MLSVTLRRQTCSAFGPTRANYAAAAAGLHARAKAVRSCTFEITGLIGTFHVERLGLLVVDFNKARQCTGRAAPRQYLIPRESSGKIRDFVQEIQNA